MTKHLLAGVAAAVLISGVASAQVYPPAPPPPPGAVVVPAPPPPGFLAATATDMPFFANNLAQLELMPGPPPTISATSFLCG